MKWTILDPFLNWKIKYSLWFILVYIKHLGHFHEEKYKKDGIMLQTRCGEAWILFQLCLELTTQPWALVPHLPSPHPPLFFLDEDVPGSHWGGGLWIPPLNFLSSHLLWATTWSINTVWSLYHQSCPLDAVFLPAYKCTHISCIWKNK